MNRAVVAIGSNIKPEEKVDAALGLISETFSVLKKSSFSYTNPVGYRDQPKFLNGSVLIETEMDKPAIVAALKHIEQELGRERDGRTDGPRRIDLDLTVFKNRVCDEDVYERDFLKQAINELLPAMELNK